MPRYIGRENLRKRLEPQQGAPGRTTYEAGSVRIELPEEPLTGRPEFGLGHEGAYETVELGPLCEALAEDHVVAALLVRLGGFAVGVFEGERLVASKVGTRFVKGRHKKGGSEATAEPSTRCSRPSRASPGSPSSPCRASSRRAIRGCAISSAFRTTFTPPKRPRAPARAPSGHTTGGGAFTSCRSFCACRVWCASGASGRRPSPARRRRHSGRRRGPRCSSSCRCRADRR